LAADTIAKRYGKALSQLCDATQNHTAIFQELKGFVVLYNSSDDLQEMVCNPVVEQNAKKETLQIIVEKMGLSQLAKNFLLYLVDRQRLEYIEAILDDFEGHIDRAAGRVRAEITSATPLSTEEQSRIKAVLMKVSGCSEVVVETRVDASIIGGLVTRIGNVVLDGSVQNQIESMREHLRTNSSRG
jgi:F-type H+-transporting ATPase subunit delta